MIEIPKPGQADSSMNPSPKMSVARLRTVLKSEPECVRTVNSKGQFVDLNPAGLRMMGATEVEQVRGTHLSMMVDARDWPLYEKKHEFRLSRRDTPVAIPLQFPKWKTTLDGTNGRPRLLR